MAGGNGSRRKRAKKRKHNEDRLVFDTSGDRVYFTRELEFRPFIEALHASHEKDSAINGRPVYRFRLPFDVELNRRGEVQNPNITDVAAEWLQRYMNGNATIDLKLDPVHFAEVYRAAYMLEMDEAIEHLQSMLGLQSGSTEQYVLMLKSVSSLPKAERAEILNCSNFGALCSKIEKVFLSDKFLSEFLELDVSIINAILKCDLLKVKNEFQLVLRLLKWLQYKGNKKHAAELLPQIRYGELSSTELAYLSVQEFFEDEEGVFHDYMVDVIKQRVSDLVDLRPQGGVNPFKFTADLDWKKRSSMRAPRAHSKFFTTFNGRHYY